jgi:O-antigen/teichoic acid export membrane protein
MSWVAFFDIGLGNGLRNKLAEALAMGDIKLGRIYISTAYVTISFIALALLVILLAMLPFAPWSKIFNTVSVTNNELSIVIFTVGLFFLLNFILSLCNSVFYGYQLASLAHGRELLLNLFALVGIFLLTHYTSSSLTYLSASYGLSMVLASLLLTYYFYNKYREVTPSLRYVNLHKVRELSSLGIKFFIIQATTLIIFATDNMIITQILGPAQVTPYNVVFKLFSAITMIHTILVTPLWSAYTEAYAKGDFEWIRQTIRKLNVLMIPIIISVLILIAFARDIINIWVGPEIKFPYSLVILMGVYTILFAWNNIYAYFVNGVGRIKPQMYSSILAALMNIPISVYFATHLGLGVSGVILGSIVSLSLFAFVGPVQTYYILRRSP